jgi:S-formylglutathione hydrolase FrmB
VKGWFAHHGDPDPARLDDELPALGRRLMPADRACCCPARPMVTVVMPPTPGRPHPVDLLLCGHHYHASRAVLHAAGAAVYDGAGFLITADDGEQPSAGRKRAVAARSRSGP